MPTRPARSTADQREALIRLLADLKETAESVPGRFFVLKAEREAYKTVIQHIERWVSWEKE